jgi:3-methyladenine DNA glycosylase Mpg
MQMTKMQYGENLVKLSSLFITEGIKTSKILSNPRIGIKNGIDKLWNFKIEI